jgi:hypothetical protein
MKVAAQSMNEPD